ncbi:MAG TPA: hypothetical protein VFT69_06830 [Pseudolabrys sp.]|jgi:hypothetical protein|nr:hypothetical protein [Pseudolabrys sp.]
MGLRRATFIAALTIPCAVGPAMAQFQPQPQQEPPCVKEFVRLRTAAEEKANAIKRASERKATPQVACKLFNSFSAAELKLMKYAEENATWCGIPAQIVDNMKKAHVKTDEIRTRICKIAANPPRPRGPSLSDALGASVPNADNIKTGHGTFDTLTGAPLGSR